MPNKEQDLSKYSKETQERILAHRAQKEEEEEAKVDGYRKARTMLAIGMASITLGGPIGIIIGLFLVIYSVKYDSSNAIYILWALLIIFFIGVGLFFTLLM